MAKNRPGMGLARRRNYPADGCPPSGSRCECDPCRSAPNTSLSLTLLYPKAVVNVQELARSYTEEAVRTLVEALADPRLKVQAACALLDRAWGRPKQQIEATGDGSMALHLLAAQSVSAELLSALDEHRVIDGRAEPDQVDDLLSHPPALE